MSTQQELTPPKVKLSPLSDAIGKRFIGHTLIDDSDSDVLLVFEDGIVCEIGAHGESCDLRCETEDRYNQFGLHGRYSYNEDKLLELGVITEQTVALVRAREAKEKAESDARQLERRRRDFLELKAEFEPESINKEPT